ncbi:hypothetical protein JCM14076_06460 [Methylosoma difficile]
MPGNANPLVISPVLSGVAIKYRNQALIADKVMPRVTVDKQEFIDVSDRMADWISTVDTEVGRVGKVHALGTADQDPTYLATINNGLDEPVPNQDAMNGPSELPLMRATRRVMSLVELRREQRVAAICGNTNNFAYSLSISNANDQWDDPDSDPRNQLKEYLDKPFMRPNKLIMGRSCWSALSDHPSLVGLNRNSITRQWMADQLEVEEIIVGDGWVNGVKKGQDASKVRVWGKNCLGIYQGSNIQDGDGSWGYTAQFGARIAGTIIDSDIGMYGGVRVRAGESVREVVTATEFGFLLVDVVAS